MCREIQKKKYTFSHLDLEMASARLLVHLTMYPCKKDRLYIKMRNILLKPLSIDRRMISRNFWWENCESSFTQYGKMKNSLPRNFFRHINVE